AGVDHLVDHPEIPESVSITRADGNFGSWMARYVCAHLLADAQRLGGCAEAQAEARWNPKLQPEDLGGALALVVGFGRIGRRIGEALRALGGIRTFRWNAWRSCIAGFRKPGSWCSARP
ncbi:MAG TPA: hypothetical protein PKO12_06090, partial [Holophaga sp.]|nr:hypothetical protein [Holophaga sp.]